MIVGRDEQATERNLQSAQAAWLRARGWVAEGVRWKHDAAPQLRRTHEAFTAHEAMVLTRDEPLRYRKPR
jgi:hypothetical protein